MKVKTSELTGAALDWAVCMAKGCRYTPDIWLYEYKYLEGPRYSTDWERGGPMIERERISVGDQTHIEGQPTDSACYATNRKGAYGLGPTPLIAAMRCYVASKLGDEVDVPDELGS
jgi:hypothetical protein